jgi:hypothetical protein
MSSLFRQPIPFFLKPRLNLLEATEAHGGNLAFVMTMAVSVGRVVTHDTTVIAGIDQGIDVCEVILFWASTQISRRTIPRPFALVR